EPLGQPARPALALRDRERGRPRDHAPDQLLGEGPRRISRRGQVPDRAAGARCGDPAERRLPERDPRPGWDPGPRRRPARAGRGGDREPAPARREARRGADEAGRDDAGPGAEVPRLPHRGPGELPAPALEAPEAGQDVHDRGRPAGARDTGRPLHDQRQAGEPRLARPRLALGRRPGGQGNPARPRRPPQGALDGLLQRRRDPRDRRHVVARERGLARLHPHVDPRRDRALRPGPPRHPDLHRLSGESSLPPGGVAARPANQSAMEASAQWQEAIDAFMRELRTREASANTQRAYRADLRELGEWAAARHRPPGQLSYRDLRSYAAEFSGRRLARATVARKLAAVRAFHQHLVRTARAPENPADLLPSPKRPQRLPRVLSPERVAALLDRI